METEQSRKTEFIGFRLTAREREAIEKVASGFGLTLSDFIRDFTVRITKQIFNTSNNG
jgi:uncharacterized protein (DUF1778 family)